MAPTNRRDLQLCLGVCLVLLALVWAEPRPIDDLFIALAGGRDILAGHLGAPDDWSYTTEGRVWLNQNWGSHVLLYLTDRVAGVNGLLVLKALLLLAGTMLLALTGRTRGADWATALLTPAVAFAASRSYIDLRPNLVGVVLGCGLLWMLGRAAGRSSWLWIAVVLMGIWANMHGSFVFGLGLIALWVLVLGAATPRVLPVGIAALVVAVAASAYANPFGLENLLHPLVVGSSPAWREVAEWVPLFAPEATLFGSRWEICTLAAFFVVLLLGRLAAGGSQSSASTELTPRAAQGLAFFDLVAIIAVAVMTVGARRFVPLMAVVLAAPLAAQLTWWQRRLGSSWPTRVLALGLAIAVGVAAPPLLRRYSAENPIFAGLDTFERMVDAPTLPRGPVEFLRTNGISGRAYAAWEWEGYLRWKEAPVTVMIGSRAQQVYDEPILQLHKDIRTGATGPREALKGMQVGLAILPLTAPYAMPLGGLVYADGSPWVYLYNDGRHAVLIDTSRPELAATVQALDAGTLRYATPAEAATSRMMYVASPHMASELAAIQTAAEEAARAAPTALAYAVLGDVALSDRAFGASVRAFLAAERDRLAALAAEHGDDFKLAQARLAEVRTEAILVARTVDPEGVQRTRAEVEARQNLMHETLLKWAYGWDPNVY